MSIGNSLDILSQGILVGISLVVSAAASSVQVSHLGGGSLARSLALGRRSVTVTRLGSRRHLRRHRCDNHTIRLSSIRVPPSTDTSKASRLRAVQSHTISELRTR